MKLTDRGILTIVLLTIVIPVAVVWLAWASAMDVTRCNALSEAGYEVVCP